MADGGLKTAWHRRPTAILAMAASLGVAGAQEPVKDPPRRGTAPVFEVQLRGPIHEGFAQPAVLELSDALRIPKQPPPALNEFPTLLRPAAAQAVWLPGYWGWDDAKENFIWVTGTWRLPPPGMRWIPGYWSARDEQFTWTSGFWLPAERSRLDYQSDAPAAKGDKGDLPDATDNAFYVPGYWVKTSGGYVWRRGHWSPHHEGWVWMPTRRVTTPAGSLLLRGYWDYPLAQRGLLFAPVAVTNVHETSGALTPQTLLNVAGLSGWLFTWPAYGHYCFGDYFSAAERQRGIAPWLATSSDPIFSYERWRRAAAQPNWQTALAAQFERRRIAANTGGEDPALRRLVIPIQEWSKAPGAPLPLATSSYEARAAAARSAVALVELARERASFETASNEVQGSEKTAAFTLPALAAQPAPRRVPSVGTTGEFIPGTSGRDVPGFGRRTLPGVAGRAVPGVDTDAPGVVAPGVVPGVDTRLPPGAGLSQPQTPRRP